jgi:glycosyltransferase involved in cell wall biosynthesis
MPTPLLSVITHYYNHPNKVREQVEHWGSIDKQIRHLIEFIVVDDCSEHPASLDDSNGINLRRFRVISDIAWNQSGARNLGGFHATGQWALFFDIDQRINTDTVPHLLAGLQSLDAQTMYYLKIKELYGSTPDEHLTNHPNTFLVNLARFKTHGMYDEDFAGHYGYEDLYLPKVWEMNGGKRALLSDFDFFENIEFRTGNLNRDSNRNHHLALFKMATGCKNSPGIMRFDWEAL